jgi:glucose uptake protein
MFIIENYGTAILFCVITMLCWGSWANTQKLASKTWRFELFYWDYVIGILLFSIISAFTLESIGNEGRSFTQDIAQADTENIASAFIGGIIFNAANILVAAAISIAGMSVAFPVGIGLALALVLGVLINYFAARQGNATLLFTGVAFIAIAIVINAITYSKKNAANQKVSAKGIVIAIIGGILMSFFYRFIAKGMDMENFHQPAAGKMTPYTAVFVFSVGVFISNLLFNTILIKKPFEGLPVSYTEYFRGKFSTHLVGILGGLIWGIGNSFNLIAAGKAGPAISYGLGQGATLVAALWGVLIWKEFKNAPKGTNKLIAAMFFFFVAGLVLLVYAGK